MHILHKLQESPGGFGFLSQPATKPRPVPQQTFVADIQHLSSVRRSGTEHETVSFICEDGDNIFDDTQLFLPHGLTKGDGSNLRYARKPPFRFFDVVDLAERTEHHASHKLSFRDSFRRQFPAFRRQPKPVEDGIGMRCNRVGDPRQTSRNSQHRITGNASVLVVRRFRISAEFRVGRRNVPRPVRSLLLPREKPQLRQSVLNNGQLVLTISHGLQQIRHDGIVNGAVE